MEIAFPIEFSRRVGLSPLRNGRRINRTTGGESRPTVNKLSLKVIMANEDFIALHNVM